MHRVYTKVNRAPRTDKIPQPPSPLRRKIKDRSAPRSSLRNLDRGRKLVRRVNQSSGSLHPRHQPARFGSKIPPENYRGDAGPGKCASSDMLQILLPLRGHDLVVRRRGICPPERHDIPRQFKPPAEHPGMKRRRQISPSLKANRKKLKIGALSNSSPALQERAELPISTSSGSGRLSLRVSRGSRS